MEERLKKIAAACEWVSSKGGGVTVTTRVRWADWERKRFSPAMAVLWHLSVVCVDSPKDGYDTFRIPNTDAWIDLIAGHLQVDPAWVRDFVDQCHNGVAVPRRIAVTVTFDGFEPDPTGNYSNFALRNPRVEWKDRPEVAGGLLPEVQHCIDKYGEPDRSRRMPYWTKAPPVAQYQRKLLDAVLNLFWAREELPGDNS